MEFYVKDELFEFLKIIKLCTLKHENYTAPLKFAVLSYMNSCAK